MRRVSLMLAHWFRRNRVERAHRDTLLRIYMGKWMFLGGENPKKHPLIIFILTYNHDLLELSDSQEREI
jgi:hypothetical protein